MNRLRAFRWAGWTLAGLAALVVLAALVAGWLVQREATLQYALARLQQAIGPGLSIEEVHGSLAGAMTIGRVVYETAERRIEARNIRLVWASRELASRTVQVRELDVATLEITSKRPSSEPAVLPQSLRLPVAIIVDRAQLARLAIAGPTGEPLVLTAIAASAVSRGDRHTVTLTALDSPWAGVAGRAELAADRPFELAANLSVAGRSPRAFTLAAEARGPLERLALSAQGETPGGKATLTATLTPFARAPVEAFRLDAREVNLHDLGEGLPRTLLTARASGSIDEHGAVTATLRAGNALPGPLDRDAIPLAALAGDLAGTLDAFTLSNLALDLGKAGQFAGGGGLRGGQAELALTTANLDLAGLYSTLVSTRAAGELRLAASGHDFSEQRLDAKVTEHARKLALEAGVRHTGGVLTLETLRAAATEGRLEASGKLGLAEAQPFEFTAQLTRLNPAAFGRFPQADLNAKMAASGRLAAPFNARLQVTLADSRLRGQPLKGSGQAEIAPGRVAGVEVALDLAGNRLQASGAFGRVGDELLWRLDAGDLARLDPVLAGKAQGKGSLRGTLQDPAGSFDLAANGLRLPGAVSVASFSARGQAGPGNDGPLELALAAQGLKAGVLDLTRADARVSGTRLRHTAELEAQGKPGLDLVLAFAGGWNTRDGWRGSLERLTNRGKVAVTLGAPVALALAPGSLHVGAASLAIADGHVNLGELRWSPGRLATRGEASGLSLARAQELFPAEARADDVRASLTLGARWTLEASDAINASVRVFREQGDLTLVADPPLALGLSRLEAAAEIVANRVTASLDAVGKVTGTVSARMRTQLAQRDGAWGIPGDAPLEVLANADVPSLAWASLFLSPGYLVDGRARLTLNRTGPVGAPRVEGGLSAEGLALRVPDFGVDLRDGVLAASFAADRVLVNSFRIRAAEGELTGTGSLQLGRADSGAAEAGADIRADKLAILDHPDYKLTVSGAGKLALAAGKLTVTGEVRADKGRIRLPESSRPALSDDVVVVGKPGSKARARGATPLALDLTLDIGRDFNLTGYGLDADLRGTLRVKSAPPGLPAGLGTIRVARGTFEAYGQKLEIERGVLSFSGPIDNPALDILAVRKNLQVEPGVAVSGTALSPRVKLVSDPNVPDTEKLAWLVLGHGLEGSSRSDLELLPVAAAALLSQTGRGTPTSIAKMIGLDEIGVSSSGASGTTLAEGRVVTVGKRLASNLYLTYEAGLDAATRMVRLRYDLTRNWSLRAETGTRSALDLFYTVRLK